MDLSQELVEPVYFVEPICQEAETGTFAGDGVESGARRVGGLSPALAARPPRAAGSVARVIESFERVLRQAALKPDDDFFDLGGDSIMAVALTLELEQIFSVRLPITALFDASTPATLAALVDEAADRDASCQSPAVVLLKKGSGAPGIFIAPGAGGSPIELLPVARLIETDGPVYGLQSPGLDGRQQPLDRIEDMAAYFLPCIRAAQPHGPYLLVGYSMGGLTAVEMARLLMAAGETVAMLVLLDATLPRRKLLPRVKFRIWAARTRHHVAKLSELRAREVLPYALTQTRTFLDDIGVWPSQAPREGGGDGRAVEESAPAREETLVSKGGRAAVMRYRQRYLPAPITFIQAENNRRDLVWKGAARRLAVRLVNGDHWTMLSVHGAEVAACISRCAREALRTARRREMRAVGKLDGNSGGFG